jgi:hypothetical protein
MVLRINYYMKSVRIYYAGIPPKNNKIEKRLVLENFHFGVTPGWSKEINTPKWEPADLAVLQGWVHEDSQTTPHLMFRKQVIEQQKSIGKHTLAIDSNLFLYKDPGNTKNYLRFSLDGIFPTTGEYFTKTVDPMRWQTIKTNLGLDLQPWKPNGTYILICLQRNGGWSMGKLDVVDWCNNIIKTLSQYTDREIVVRAHPGDRRANDYLKKIHPQVKISTNPSIVDDLKHAWATITYNSSPGVASAIEGVPVFVTDPSPKKSQAFDIANFDLSKIESPRRPERRPWIEKLSMCHFNFDELRQGVAWNIIREYI